MCTRITSETKNGYHASWDASSHSLPPGVGAASESRSKFPIKGLHPVIWLLRPALLSSSPWVPGRPYRIQSGVLMTSAEAQPAASLLSRHPCAKTAVARATRWRQTLSHAGRLRLRTAISCPARPAPFNAAASGCKGAAGQAEGQCQMCHVPAREHLLETQGGLLLPHLLPLPGGFQKAHLPQNGGLGGKASNSPPPDWLPPGFCVTCCHTVSLLRTLDHERHGSAGRRAAVLWGEDSGSLCLV